MSSSEIREVLHRHIDQMDDRFLRVLHSITQEYFEQQKAENFKEEMDAIAPPPWVQPKTKSDFLSDLKKADAQIDHGESITLEALKEKSEGW